MRFLSLAPTPTFALLALLSASHETSLQSLLCSSGHSSPFTGMVFMYLLMSVFHSTPWIRVMRKLWPGAARRNADGHLTDVASYYFLERATRRSKLNGFGEAKVNPGKSAWRGLSR
jgi:hypothetical protein